MTDLALMAARASDIVGWTLIHFLWQGTALALALAFVQLLLPRGMARARYVAGCITLGLMLVVPASTAWWLADPNEPASPFFDDVPVAMMSAGAKTPTAAPSAASPLAPEASTTRRVVVDPSGWLPWLVLAWSLGVLACSIRLAGGWWHARQLVSRGTRPLSAEWQDVRDRLAERLGLTRAVTLLESTRLQVPVVVGWLRPVLIVPTAVLGGLSPQQIEAVIAHELAHIRRHDYLVNLLQSAVETLLFYHPAVWWVSRSVRVEREHCCDDLAVVACGDAVLYARALTAIETMRYEEMGVAMAVTGSPLVARVRRLLGVKPPATVASSAWVVALVTAMMVSGAGITSWMRAVPVELAGPEASTAQAPPPAALPVASTVDDRHDQAERALEAAARAVERAERVESTRKDRADRSESRQLAREAMRQAHEMVRAAQQAIREAARAVRESEREARGSWHFWSDDAEAPEAPEPPEAPEAPEPPEAPMPPMPPAAPLPPLAPMAQVPPAPPAPPAPPSVPAPPAPPAPPESPSGWSWEKASANSSWNATHTTNGVTQTIHARGKVEFNEDENDVLSLSPGGSFAVERRVGGIGGFFASDVKRFEARERNGSIERKYFVDGRELGADEGRRWLATFLPQTLRNMAINADRRVARQLAKGGPALVLAEVTKTEGTFAKSVYLRELYKQAQLDPQTLGASLSQAGRELESDFELGPALKAAADNQPIDTAMPAFVQATRTMESDFEQRGVLQKALARPGLTAESAGAIFKSAAPGPGGAGIESAFALAELLKKGARSGHVTDANVTAYLATAQQVKSDFERRGVVQALASVNLSDAHMADVVRLASSIGSDFEKSEAIVKLSRTTPIGSVTRKALADAAMGIGSEFERGKALTALSRAGVLGAK